VETFEGYMTGVEPVTNQGVMHVGIPEKNKKHLKYVIFCYNELWMILKTGWK